MTGDGIFRSNRRQFLAGTAQAVSLAGLPAMARGVARRQAGEADPPDLGPNVVVLGPGMAKEAMQGRVDAIFRRQESDEFGEGRYAILLEPGTYDLDVNVGFYTQVAGLGQRPDDVVIRGHVHAEADWNHGMALVNFWRGIENVAIRPADGLDRWAVSQAAPYRRVDLAGDLALDDGGWSSGGFIADTRVSGTVRSGTQQQWFTRTSAIGGWQGSNWNMMFVGVEGAPSTRFPDPPYTSLAAAPRIREKPWLTIGADGGWGVFRPVLRTNARGPSWGDGPPAGDWIALSHFLIATPGIDAAAINAALARGRHVLFTPGIYPLAETILVPRPGTILLGLGLATLVATAGQALIRVGDIAGVTIAGLLLEAGEMRSPVLLQIGERAAAPASARDPILLADLFFRVGGATIGRVDTALEINRSHTIADHVWIWRADHGDRRRGKVHVGWAESTGEQGLVVNGDHVTVYGLFVEHFRRHQVLWNGERGQTYFFQCELPYDPPTQSAWRADDARGWAAYRVADSVRHHEATGLGIYANFTADPSIVLHSAVEAPETPGVRFASITTIALGGGKGTIAHPVNDAGAAARAGAVRQTLTRYPVGSGAPG